MKLAIIGSRKFTDYDLLCDQISRIYPKVECVISGGAIGADSLAKRWATENSVDYIEYPAEWEKYGRSAGYKRNQLIVDDADELIAFWDGTSRGTKHSIEMAKKKRIPVTIIDYTGVIR